MNIINKFLSFKVIQNLVFLFLLSTLVFGRSFMGLYIFNFRVGELLIGLSLISSLLLLIDFSNFQNILGSKAINFHILIFLSFLLSLLINQGNFLNEYTYKSSSYLWSISAVYLGILFFKNFKFGKWRIIVLNFSLIYVYVLSTVNYPEFLINFFLDFSDKWDFNKASSLGIFFVVVVLINFEFNNSKNASHTYFIFASSLFLPLFLFKSRGSFIAVILFVALHIIIYRKELFNTPYKTAGLILLAIIVLMVSTIFILNKDVEQLIEDDALFSLFYDGEAVKQLQNQKDTKVDSFLSFYTRDGRLYSIDGNINWRMQIWQDVIFDSIDDNKVIFGIGYKDKIPAMQIFERQGRDGLNENVHNFLFNIYARGGLFQLFLFITFYYLLIIKNDKKIKISSNLFLFSLPVFIISFFDTSMENAHFPFIFYFFMSLFITNKK